jgi:uncharacterized membrane protein YdjX (TVP38/TMEM64 family)
MSLKPGAKVGRHGIISVMKSPTQRLLLIIVGVLLIPLIPFLLMGSWFEPWLESLLDGSALETSMPVAFSSVVGILSADILLPIPSSAVCTFAGKQLGALTGTAACWVGLNISAGIGYLLGAKFGRPIAVRFSDEATLQKLEELDKRSSVACLVVCRSLPIIAEASVLLMGMKRLPQGLFWSAVLLSNLGIAAALCWLGSFSAKANWFPLALGISIAIPLLFILFWKAKR